MDSKIYKSITKNQLALCEKYGAEYLSPNLTSKLGISRGALEGILPLHGIRHMPNGGLSGWYIWSGDYSKDNDFFEALHVVHAFCEHTLFSRYLGLAPGWRFLIGENGYEDVWFDSSLLEE